MYLASIVLQDLMKERQYHFPQEGNYDAQRGTTMCGARARLGSIPSSCLHGDKFGHVIQGSKSSIMFIISKLACLNGWSVVVWVVQLRDEAD